MKFSDGQAKRVHERIHTGTKRFTCRFCGKGFIRKAHLVSHERIHTGEKPFTCEVCGKSFADKRNLKPHVRAHTGEKPHKCVICGAGFERATSLRDHMAEHLKAQEDESVNFVPVISSLPKDSDPAAKGDTAQGANQTDKNAKSFDYKNRCLICGMIFQTLQLLNDHVAEHSEDEFPNSRKEHI